MGTNVIAGIDVGFKRCGMALFSGGKPVLVKTIRTEKSDNKKRKVRVADDMVERSQRHYRAIKSFLQEHDVAGAIVELPTTGAKSSIALRDMSYGAAVTICVLEELSLPVEWVPPSHVKQLVNGGSRKSATKEQVRDFVIGRYPELADMLPEAKVEWEHIADAVAVYLAAEHGQLVRLLSR